MKRSVSGLLLIAAAAIWLAFSSVTALAERRVALVIGNSSYQNVARLPNPRRDAEAIAQMFTKAGFEAVQLRTDLGYLDFRRTLRRFEDASAGADIAVIFYAGHGLELNGTNYLLPIDAKLAVDRDARDEAIELGRLIEAVESSKRLSLVILDACRDNPFLNTMKRQRQAVRSTTRGSGLVDPTGEMRKDMLIAYAAKEGSTADDGNREHSPYTTAILHNLTEPGLDIRLAFGRIRDEVLKATNNKQEPYVYTSMGGGSISLVPTPTQPKPPSEDEVRGDYNTVMKAFEAVHTRAPLDVFMNKYPTGFYTDLVREQLKKFESEQELATREPASRPRSPPLSAEALAWDDVKNSSDKDAILKFMRLYRNSPKYVEAQSRLKLILEREMNDAWEAAQAANNPLALQDFAARHPQSPHASEAKRRANQLIQAAQERERQERAAKAEAEMNNAWEAAQAANNPLALQDFVRRYPDSPFVSEAKGRADQLIQAAQEKAQAEAAEARRHAIEAAAAGAWKAVQNSNNPADLQGFIKAFPDSSLALNEATQRLGVLDREAKERVERAQTEAANARLAWDEIKNSTDQVVLQEFIARYANTPVAQTDARDRLEELRRRQREEVEASTAWNKLKGTDSATQLRDFASRYPAFPLAIEAAQRAAVLDRELKERAEKAAEAAAARALWSNIKNTNNPAVVRNFLDRYPNSPLALNEAKKLLDALEDAARKIEEKARTDAEAATAWAKIKDTSDRAELRNFIDRYSASPLALNDAKKRLIVLEREAMELEKKAPEGEQPRPTADGGLQKPQRDGLARVAPPPIPQQQICQRDQERLALLRTSPMRDEVVRFEHELGCERLRPQLLRLLESISTEGERGNREAVQRPQIEQRRPTADAELQMPERDASTRVAAPSIPQEQICQRDQERLTRLRASPNRDEVVRFEHELGCDRLRPQLLRLRESLGAN